MISLDGMETNQVEIKKEISRTFLRMGLFSLCAGILALLMGYLLGQKSDNFSSLSFWPLLISIPIIVIINWLLMRGLLKKIHYHSLGHD